nr:UEV domain-containing protein [Colletotrichum truncatum]KAF6794684.1 UEV domain-containing protein [Colletotrichum truncatum]
MFIVRHCLSPFNSYFLFEKPVLILIKAFDNGASALLLHLSGTIPVIFRGTTYRFPISVWVPHAYPREAPLVYVTPTESMMVRPGQHVDPQGQVYHPYLVGWSAFWDKSTILDFLAILRDVFAKEPPVVARPQGKQQPSTPTQPPGQTPPPVPPLPPDLVPRAISRQSVQTPVDQSRPPPPPPKASNTEPSYRTPPPLPADGRSGPPLPPLPPSINRGGSRGDPSLQQPPQFQDQNYSRYDSAPPLPPTAATQQKSSTLPPRLADEFGQKPLQQVRPEATPPHSTPFVELQYSPPSQRLPQQYNGASGWQQAPEQYQPPFQHHQSHSQQLAPHVQQASKPAPPPDLLDEPLTLSIPSPSSMPAPPIPPNPEKDALLHQLAQTLYNLRQRSRQQNESSMAGLQAQRTAMLSAFSTLQSEMGTLSQTSALLQSNASILVDALRKADTVIEGSSRQTAPDIDELLVAPTVVANQLYNLVAEEKAIGDTIFVLGRAVERGRISPAVFAKTTRSLAREWYLKKALVRKIGKGMGLAA